MVRGDHLRWRLEAREDEVDRDGGIRNESRAFCPDDVLGGGVGYRYKGS